MKIFYRKNLYPKEWVIVKDRIKQIFKTEFLKNFLILFKGSFSAQVILLLISPILTRIYTPEDFAVLALFTALSTTAGMIANAIYDFAIGLAENEEEAINLVALCLLNSAIISFIVLVVIMLFPHQIVLLLNNPNIDSYLYFIPLVTFLIGAFNTLNYYSIRLKNFNAIAKANFYRQIAASFFQLILGFLTQGALGLISGRIALHFTGVYILFSKSSRIFKNSNSVKKQEIIRLAKRYKDFPFYTLPAQLSNVLSQQLNILFISSLFSAATLGFYSLLNSVVNMPLSLIGKSLGQVYLQRATEERKRIGNSISTFRNTFLLLFTIGLIIFIPLYFVVEQLFGFVFGENWLVAGTYTKILIPMFFVRFITSALSVTNIVFEKQLFGFIWQIGLLLITITIYIIANRLDLSIETFLEITSAALSAYYLLLTIMSYMFAKGKEKYID